MPSPSQRDDRKIVEGSGSDLALVCLSLFLANVVGWTAILKDILQ